jgi:hypothetical protein
MMLAATGLAILSTMTQVDGTYLMLLSGLLPMAIGMGMTFVPLTLVATAGVEADDAGLASGTFNTSQQIGGALGLAVLATLASNKTTSVLENVSGAPAVQDRKIALVEGFQTAFVASASLTAFGLLMVVLLMRRRDVESVHIGEAAPVPV